jgi:transcriptional regulator with XRE-family HTH domain
MVNMGERLRTLRSEKRLTQTEVSRRVGVTKSMISSYELEQRQPSYDVLIKLAAFFCTTTDYLLGVERERMVNVKGLNEKEVDVLTGLVEILRDK